MPHWDVCPGVSLDVRVVSNLKRGISRAPYLSEHRPAIRRCLGLSVWGSPRRIGRSYRLPRYPDEPRTRGQPAAVAGGFPGAAPSKRPVARGEELGRVPGALEAAIAGKAATGRMVLLSGEPDIGKTQLTQEVNGEARESGFLVAAGRCYKAQDASRSRREPEPSTGAALRGAAYLPPRRGEWRRRAGARGAGSNLNRAYRRSEASLAPSQTPGVAGRGSPETGTGSL